MNDIIQDYVDRWIERAAIAEHCGELTQGEAEKVAWDEVKRAWNEADDPPLFGQIALAISRAPGGANI